MRVRLVRNSILQIVAEDEQEAVNLLNFAKLYELQVGSIEFCEEFNGN